MATQPKGADTLDALIQQAAREIRAANRHIGETLPPLSDADCAQLLADDAEVDRIFDEFERNGGFVTKTIAEIVSEDRGK